jgi:hypothetical protein
MLGHFEEKFSYFGYGIYKRKKKFPRKIHNIEREDIGFKLIYLKENFFLEKSLRQALTASGS